MRDHKPPTMRYLQDRWEEPPEEYPEQEEYSDEESSDAPTNSPLLQRDFRVE